MYMRRIGTVRRCVVCNEPVDTLYYDRDIGWLCALHYHEREQHIPKDLRDERILELETQLSQLRDALEDIRWAVKWDRDIVMANDAEPLLIGDTENPEQVNEIISARYGETLTVGALRRVYKTLTGQDPPRTLTRDE